MGKQKELIIPVRQHLNETLTSISEKSGLFSQMIAAYNAGDEFKETAKNWLKLILFPIFGAILIIAGFAILFEETLLGFLFLIFGSIIVFVGIKLLRRQVNELLDKIESSFCINEQGALKKTPHAKIKEKRLCDLESIRYLGTLEEGTEDDFLFIMDKDKNLLFDINPTEYEINTNMAIEFIKEITPNVQVLAYDELKKLPWMRKKMLIGWLVIIGFIILAILEIFYFD